MYRKGGREGGREGGRAGGHPNVSDVIFFKGRLKTISRLPCAEEEAKMVGRKLGVQPLLGRRAIKRRAVLQQMESVAWIFAC